MLCIYELKVYKLVCYFLKQFYKFKAILHKIKKISMPICLIGFIANIIIK